MRKAYIVSLSVATIVLGGSIGGLSQVDQDAVCTSHTSITADVILVEDPAGVWRVRGLHELEDFPHRVQVRVMVIDWTPVFSMSLVGAYRMPVVWSYKGATTWWVPDGLEPQRDLWLPLVDKQLNAVRDTRVDVRSLPELPAIASKTYLATHRVGWFVGAYVSVLFLSVTLGCIVLDVAKRLRARYRVQRGQCAACGYPSVWQATCPECGWCGGRGTTHPC